MSVKGKFRNLKQNLAPLPEPLKLKPWESAAKNAVKAVILALIVKITRYICKNAIFKKERWKWSGMSTCSPLGATSAILADRNCDKMVTVLVCGSVNLE